MAIKSINAQGGDIILINNEVLDDKTLSIINTQFDSVSAELNDLSIITREQWIDIFEISSIISTNILSDINTISDNITAINSNITNITSDINTLKNAKLISATSISETAGTKNYELSNSIIKINNVQIGNQWIKTTDKTIGGIKIELVGGDCDFNIGNNNAERDLVLETNNNSSNIKLNSKTIAAKAVKYDNWNNIEDKSDNTLVPKSYVDTSVNQIQESVNQIQESVNNKIKINNTPVETLSFKITDEIPATPIENEFYLVTDSTLNMYGNKITNVAPPENGTDVATKEYVDALINSVGDTILNKLNTI